MSRVDTDIQECGECVSPAEAFSIVGNETRLSILEALWAAETRPVRFSRLRERVGMRDSAQFNYHLDKLTGQFVVRTEEGYDLRNAGERVVQAVLAGSFNEHPELELTIESPCTRCGEPLDVYYEDEQLTIECLSCGRGHGTYPFPPGGLHDRSQEEILTAFEQRVRHLHCLAADGVCPACSGRMRTTISHDGECCLGVGLRADHVCEQCNNSLCSAVGLSLLDHSAVVAFHSDHGIDLGSTPYWRFEWCVSDDHTTVLSEDPWQLRVEIGIDDETLSVVLDGDLTVIETERVRTTRHQ
jgi:DNA-binding transcriptional ArsR family regulator